MSCPFKVGDRIVSVINSAGVATVTKVGKESFNYDLEKPIKVNSWTSWRSGQCLSDGFHMWRKLEQ